MQDIHPTPSQAVLQEKMQRFLASSERIFRLTGKPGVGKSFMTALCFKEHIEADRISQSGFNMNIAGICLAHTAKAVLGDFIPNVFTFAKAYGLKEVINEITGERTFEYNKYQDVVIGEMDVPVFVHDEVSQYTPEMLRIVLETTPIFSKIILIGDRAQLPPIDSKKVMPKDSDSPVFMLNLPESCQHELTERVRQAEGNPILDLSDIIREEIFGKQDIHRVLQAMSTPRIVDGMGYDFIKYDDFFPDFQTKDVLNTKFLAYKNKTVNRWNPDIRNYLLDTPDNIIIQGDVVTMIDNFYKVNPHDPQGRPEFVLYNGDTFRLGETDTCLVTHTVGATTYRIACYVSKIDGQPDKEFLVPTESGKPVLENALKEISDKCKGKGRSLRWQDHFWPLYKMFARYTYGYCQSVYKSQGSTYDSVYLDVNDILTCGPLTPKRKLQSLYTAVTRTKTNVKLLKSNR